MLECSRPPESRRPRVPAAPHPGKAWAVLAAADAEAVLHAGPRHRRTEHLLRTGMDLAGVEWPISFREYPKNGLKYGLRLRA